MGMFLWEQFVAIDDGVNFFIYLVDFPQIAFILCTSQNTHWSSFNYYFYISYVQIQVIQLYIMLKHVLAECCCCCCCCCCSRL